jgi:hypothetical protein
MARNHDGAGLRFDESSFRMRGAMFDLKWSPDEKKVAHRAFDAALVRERMAIRRHVEALLRDTDDGTVIWAIRDYLNEVARDIDYKFDFRYSVLINVFGRLVAEGALPMDELAGLGEDKLAMIAERAEVWRRGPSR